MLTSVSGFQLGKSEIPQAGLVFMAYFSSLDMSLQDSTLSREGKPEAEIMAAVFFSVGPLVSWDSLFLTYSLGLRACLLFPKACDFSTSPTPLLRTQLNRPMKIEFTVKAVNYGRIHYTYLTKYQDT